MSADRSILLKIIFRLREKILLFKSNIRLQWLKLLGLKIGYNCKLGKIFINIPEQVIIGDNCVIEDQVRLRPGGPWKQSFIEIGKNTFIGHSTQINVGNRFKIGDNCMIAPLTVFTDATHGFEDLTIPMKSQPCRYDSIEVKDDVWIGSGCVILGGVTVGKGVIVAAGAVVNRDIPDYEIWGGVPAKKIKSRN